MADDQESNNPFLKNYIIKIIRNQTVQRFIQSNKERQNCISDKISRVRVRKENGIRVLKVIRNNR